MRLKQNYSQSTPLIDKRLDLILDFFFLRLNLFTTIERVFQKLNQDGENWNQRIRQDRPSGPQGLPGTRRRGGGRQRSLPRRRLHGVPIQVRFHPRPLQGLRLLRRQEPGGQRQEDRRFPREGPQG